MVIKVTLFALVVLLIAVITLSYYMNVEGFDNLSSSTFYNFYVNRYNDPSGAPRCLSTLPNNSIGTWECVKDAPQQMWRINENGNLVSNDPVYANKCVQAKLDNSLTFEDCSPTSTKFSYVNNQLTIQGSNKCVNLKGGEYTNGSPVDTYICSSARPDTVTWFSKQVASVTPVAPAASVTSVTPGTPATSAAPVTSATSVTPATSVTSVTSAAPAASDAA